MLSEETHLYKKKKKWLALEDERLRLLHALCNNREEMVSARLIKAWHFARGYLPHALLARTSPAPFTSNWLSLTWSYVTVSLTLDALTYRASYGSRALGAHLALHKLRYAVQAHVARSLIRRVRVALVVDWT